MKRNVEPLRTNKRHRDILGNPQPGTRQMLRGQRDFTRVRSTRFQQPFGRDKGLTSNIIAAETGSACSFDGRVERVETWLLDRREVQVEGRKLDRQLSAWFMRNTGHYFVYISLSLSCPEKTLGSNLSEEYRRKVYFFREIIGVGNKLENNFCSRIIRSW